MILVSRGASLRVFSVDQHEVQITWRHLRPGTLQLRCADTVVEVLTTTAPGAAILAGLPAGSLLTVEASGDALLEPVQLTARTLGRLPGEELCRLATISDLHLGTEVFGHRGTITDPVEHPDPHPVRCAEAAIDELTSWGAQHLVAKGDITNQGTAAQWREYARLVARATMPVDAVPGNHDHGRPGVSGPLLPAEAADAFGLSIARPMIVRDLPGLRLVLVDTTRGGRHGGTIERHADDVLAAATDAPRDGGVLVVLHHHLHPNPLHEGWPPGIDHLESRAFLERLGAVHPHALVTSGHTHRNRRWGRAGVVVTQVGSTKDYPGVWAGYVVHEGGLRQIVRRVARPDCLAWTDHSRRAAFGAWEHAAPGRLDARCFNVAWSVRAPVRTPA